MARVEAEQAMREALSLRKWDIIISDYSLPSFDAPRALATLKDSGQDIPFLVVSGCVDESTIIEAMKAGADDYLMKENLSRLVPAVIASCASRTRAASGAGWKNSSGKPKKWKLSAAWPAESRTTLIIC